MLRTPVSLIKLITISYLSYLVASEELYMLCLINKREGLDSLDRQSFRCKTQSIKK